MAKPDAARELYRVIQKHVRGDGSKQTSYAKLRQALRKTVGDAKMPACVRRHATLARCNKYLREHGGESVKKRLDFLAREFEPLLTHKAAKTGAPSTKPAAVPASALDVFISHSSRDRKLAEAVVDLLRAALGLSRASIRCTSVPGYQLAGGANVDANLRRESVSARVFIALVTPASIRSVYVLFELGARWGIDPENSVLIPLVAGINARDVPAPLSSLHLVDASKQPALHDLVEQVGKVLGMALHQPSDYAGKLETVTDLAKVTQPKLSKYEQRVVRALFGEAKGRRMSRDLADPNYDAAVKDLQGKGIVKPNGKRYVLTELGNELAYNLLQSL